MIIILMMPVFLFNMLIDQTSIFVAFVEQSLREFLKKVITS